MTDAAQAYWKKTLDLVEKNGWAIIGVFSDGVTPQFSYTVGLSAKGKPELLMIGVDLASAQTILNAAARKLLAGEFSGARGEFVDELAVVPLAPRIANTQAASEYALSAVKFARESGLPLSIVHVVIPDSNGFFPWQSECAPGMIACQTISQDPWADATVQ